MVGVELSLTVIINELGTRGRIIQKVKKKVILSWALWPKSIISATLEVGGKKNHELKLAWL